MHIFGEAYRLYRLFRCYEGIRGWTTSIAIIIIKNGSWSFWIAIVHTHTHAVRDHIIVNNDEVMGIEDSQAIVIGHVAYVVQAPDRVKKRQWSTTQKFISISSNNLHTNTIQSTRFSQFIVAHTHTPHVSVAAVFPILWMFLKQSWTINNSFIRNYLGWFRKFL